MEGSNIYTAHFGFVFNDISLTDAREDCLWRPYDIPDSVHMVS